MPVINRIASFHKDMTAWRHDIHSHPETAFEEVRTADVVAEKLKSFGLEVHRGLAKTGVFPDMAISMLQAGDEAGERSKCRPPEDDPSEDFARTDAIGHRAGGNFKCGIGERECTNHPSPLEGAEIQFRLHSRACY